jgi:protein SCO1/2
MTRSLRLTLILLFLMVILIFGFVIARQTILAVPDEPTPAPELSDINAYVYDNPRPLTDFSLTDEQGQPFTPSDLKGQWTFAFVGYTNCPDICPGSMASLRDTDELLPANLPQPKYLLITADPEHDTPEQLRDYVGFFGEHFQGATGDLDVLRELAKSLGAVFVQRDADGELLVDHSGHFALINPDGEMAAILQPPHDPENLAEAFRQIYDWTRENHDRASRS